MSVGEKSRYKSWSNLKKQMNDLLCDPLKGHITYFYTSYHEVQNAYGRATINCDKKELAAFSWVEMYAQERDVSRLWQAGERPSYEEMLKEKWQPACTLCEADFLHSLTVFLKTDIAASLQSENDLLRVFAYLDRRVGKRTLVKIRESSFIRSGVKQKGSDSSRIEQPTPARGAGKNEALRGLWMYEKKSSLLDLGYMRRFPYHAVSHLS